MRGVNKAILMGHVGQDPEIRTIPSGARVAVFSLATSRRWNDKAGQQQESTQWHRIQVWDRLVDVVERYVKKGDPLFVEGEIEYRQYQDKDGVTKYATEIRAHNINLIGGSRNGDASGEGGRSGSRSRSGSREMAGAGASTGGGAGGAGGDYADYQAPAFEDDDDLPF